MAREGYVIPKADAFSACKLRPGWAADNQSSHAHSNLTLPMRMLKSATRSAAGSEIAEAALVLPVVFVFLLGIIWFGRAFNVYSTIQQAAQQGALVAARPTCATCGNAQAAVGAVTATVEAAMNASSLNPGQIMASNPKPILCPSPPYASAKCSTASDNVAVCFNTQLNALQSGSQTSQAPVCGTLVSFQYPFQFYLPFTSLNLTQVILTAQAQSRMEN